MKKATLSDAREATRFTRMAELFDRPEFKDRQDLRDFMAMGMMMSSVYITAGEVRAGLQCIPKSDLEELKKFQDLEAKYGWNYTHDLLPSEIEHARIEYLKNGIELDAK